MSTNDKNRENGDANACEIELLPLNSNLKNLDTPDILLDPNKIEPDTIEDTYRERKLSRLRKSFSKKISMPNIIKEKDDVKLDEETKQVRITISQNYQNNAMSKMANYLLVHDDKTKINRQNCIFMN